jgi:hypothetical protein
MLLPGGSIADLAYEYMMRDLVCSSVASVEASEGLSCFDSRTRILYLNGEQLITYCPSIDRPVKREQLALRIQLFPSNQALGS